MAVCVKFTSLCVGVCRCVCVGVCVCALRCVSVGVFRCVRVLRINPITPTVSSVSTYE